MRDVHFFAVNRKQGIYSINKHTHPQDMCNFLSTWLGQRVTYKLDGRFVRVVNAAGQELAYADAP